MSSPQHLRTGSMFLMIATMISGVLAVLILLPAYDRKTGFQLPSAPSPQTPEALVASEKLRHVFNEFQGKKNSNTDVRGAAPRTSADAPRRPGFSNDTTHTQNDFRSRRVLSSQVDSTIISRTAHAAQAANDAGATDNFESQTPQVYVPVTVHPVTVNIDNGSLTAEVSRLTATMERLMAGHESTRLEKVGTDHDTQSKDSDTQAEILAIRQRLDEINVALANLSARESHPSPSHLSSSPTSHTTTVTTDVPSAGPEEPVTADAASEPQTAAMVEPENELSLPPAPSQPLTSSQPLTDDVPVTDVANTEENPFETISDPPTATTDRSNETQPSFSETASEPAQTPVEFPEDNPFSEMPDEPASEVPPLPTLSEPTEQLEPQPTESESAELPLLPPVTSEQPVSPEVEVPADSQASAATNDQAIPVLDIPMQVYEDSSLRTDVPLPTIPVSLPQPKPIPQHPMPMIPISESTNVQSPYPPTADLTVPPMEAQGEHMMAVPEPEYELPPLMTPAEELHYHKHAHQSSKKKSLFPQGFNYDLMDLPSPKLPKLSKLQFPKLPKPNIRGPKLPNWEALTQPDPDVPQWVDQLRDTDPLAPVREAQSVHRGLSALRFAGGSRTVD